MGDPKPGYCHAIGGGDVRGGSDNWNGNEWNVALKADEYNINDLELCMNVACLQYNDCVGVTWHATPYCYVWDSCNFDNLQGNSQWTTLKKIGMFIRILIFFKNFQVKEIKFQLIVRYLSLFFVSRSIKMSMKIWQELSLVKKFYLTCIPSLILTILFPKFFKFIFQTFQNFESAQILYCYYQLT